MSGRAPHARAAHSASASHGAACPRAHAGVPRASTAVAPARRVALRALCRADERGAYVREVLPALSRDAHLAQRDAALALRLALGVTATRGCLDELLDAFLARPRKVSPRVRAALRIAAFELLYLDRAPEVAVSQGVELVRLQAKHAAGMANAVLRRVAGARDVYLAGGDAAATAPGISGGASDAAASGEDEGTASARGEAPARDAEAREIHRAEARRAGLPLWLADAVRRSLGDDGASPLFASMLEAAPIAASFNPRAEVAGEAVFPGCAVVERAPDFLAGDALASGDAVVSDVYAQLVALAATREGSCLEVGAGRGTKTFMMCAQAARAGLSRTHVALDMYEGKCRANHERLERAGLAGAPVRFAVGDGRDLDAALEDLDGMCGGRAAFDTVFVDAPCSGTGTMRRHPEIPWRLQRVEALRELPRLQLELLRAAARRVHAGGELLYATCSVLRAENADVVDAFLATPEGAAFEVVPVCAGGLLARTDYAAAAALVRARQDGRGCLQSVPEPGGFDGHFCARLVKKTGA